jgi:hypothetical protein
VNVIGSKPQFSKIIAMLFDGDTLCEVPGLINVGSTLNGNVVSDELQRHNLGGH